MSQRNKQKSVALTDFTVRSRKPRRTLTLEIDSREDALTSVHTANSTARSYSSHLVWNEKVLLNIHDRWFNKDFFCFGNVVFIVPIGACYLFMLSFQEQLLRGVHVIYSVCVMRFTEGYITRFWSPRLPHTLTELSLKAGRAVALVRGAPRHPTGSTVQTHYSLAGVSCLY